MQAIASRSAVLGRPAVLVKHVHAVRRSAMPRKCAVRASAAGAAGEDPYLVRVHELGGCGSACRTASIL